MSGRELVNAAERGDLSAVRDLLQRGAKINFQDGHGKTATDWARERGHTLIVELLQGQELLDAAERGDVSAVGALLERGAQIDYQGELGGVTALHNSAEYGHLEVARFLLDRSARIDIKDNLGWTALIWAAMYGHLEVARLLVDRSADIDIKTNGGETAMDVARRRGHSAIAGLIEGARLREKKVVFYTFLRGYGYQSHFMESNSSDIHAEEMRLINFIANPNLSMTMYNDTLSDTILKYL